MENLKIRCSALGKIMVGATLKPLPLTEREAKDLATLQEKGSKSKRRTELEVKQSTVPTPQLLAGAKTYIRELFYSKKYDFQKQFSSKFTQKGTEKEIHSIAALNKYLGVFGGKNEKQFENDYLTGTPDVILRQLKAGIDHKNVYYPEGLRLFADDKKEENIYIWQVHGYNYLLGFKTGYVSRALMNPPHHIVEKEAWAAWRSEGNDGAPDDEFISEISERFNFEAKQPFEKRVRLHKVETTNYEIKLIQTWVGLAREYWADLLTEWENHKPKEIFTNG